MFKNIIQFLYPSLCSSCGKIISKDAVFCNLCLGEIKFVVPLILPLSERIPLTVYAACAYKDPVKNLIFKKFTYDTLACKQMSNLMLEIVPFNELQIDVFMPVPLHWTRFAWRGYNQAYLIAKNLSKELNIPVANILRRDRRTLFQSELSQQDRQNNVENVFSIKSCDTKKYMGKSIAIVDDLFTSGATVRSVAKTLLKLKPRAVSVVVFSRAI